MKKHWDDTSFSYRIVDLDILPIRNNNRSIITKMTLFVSGKKWNFVEILHSLHEEWKFTIITRNLD